MSHNEVGLYLVSNLIDKCQLGSKESLPTTGGWSRWGSFSLLDFRAMGRMFGRDSDGGVSGLLQATMCLLVALAQGARSRALGLLAGDIQRGIPLPEQS